MFTILGADGKEYGPVTAGKMHEWIAGGRANLQSKARRSGETEWKTLGDFPEFGDFGANSGGGAGVPPLPAIAAAPAEAAAAPASVPAAGYTGPATASVPADANTPLSGDIAGIAADLIARAAPLDVFGCLSRSFDLWKSNFLPLVGVTVLVTVVQLIANMIPILGIFSSIMLGGVFSGGLYYYYLGKMRGQPRELGDAFAGFSQAFVPLMLASLITFALVIAVMLPFAGAAFVMLIKAGLNNQPPDFSSIGPAAIVGIVIAFLVLFYLSVSWIFSFPLIVDKKLGPWTAMEVSRRVVTKQWFRVFLVMLMGGILTMLGLFGFLIGILFTLPLVHGAILYAYEDLCSPPKI